MSKDCGVKEPINLETITEVLGGSDTKLKLDALEELSQQLLDWNIVPTQKILVGLEDENAKVRAKTLSLVKHFLEELSQKDFRKILSFIEADEQEINQILFEEVESFGPFIEFNTLKEFLPYLWHQKREIRDTTNQLFSSLSHRITPETYIEVAEMYHQENCDTRKSIAEFLDQNGQINLIYG